VWYSACQSALALEVKERLTCPEIKILERSEWKRDILLELCTLSPAHPTSFSLRHPQDPFQNRKWMLEKRGEAGELSKCGGSGYSKVSGIPSFHAIEPRNSASVTSQGNLGPWGLYNGMICVFDFHAPC
jgi:hypothetical protein